MKSQSYQKYNNTGGPPPAPPAPPPPGVAPSLTGIPIPLAGAAPAQTDKHWYDDITTESVNDKLAEYSEIGGIASAGWLAVDGFLDTDSKTKDGMTQIDRYANNGLALGNATLGFSQNVSQFVVNRKKRNATKDKAKHANLTWNSIGNGFSMAANLTKATGGIIGLSTDLKGRQAHLDKWNEDNKDKNVEMDDYTKQSRDVLRASDWMSGLTAGLSFLGSASKAVGNTWEVVSNKRRAKALDKERFKDDIAGSGEATEKQNLTTALRTAGNNKTDPNYRNQLDHYKAFKARKYSMEQMRQFRENKGKRFPKGIISAIGSGITNGSSLASLFDKDYRTKAWGKRLRGFMPVIGIAANKLDKMFGKISDKNAANEAEDIKIGEIDKYLTKKRVKVQADVDNKLNMGANHFQMSNDEIDRITMGRLGVDISVTNDPLTNEDKLKAFEQLNLKRAKQITDISDATERGNILKAMGIDEDANLEQIAAALKGE